jgi:hypothetical protein
VEAGADQRTDHQRNLVCGLAKDDEMIDVRFVYLTGQKRPVFRNARLAGSWNGWTDTPMTAVVADDGCPAFTATVQFDDGQAGQQVQWGVRLDGPAGANAWGITTEVHDPDSQQRHRELQLPDPGVSHEERYYLTSSRRLGAQKHYANGAAVPGLRFAVWAPNARNVEIVFSTADHGYVAEDGSGIDPTRPSIPLHRTALLRCVDPGQAEGQDSLGSDRQDQFVECHRHSPVGGLFNRQLVVSAPKVLHEGMSGNDDPGAAVLFEAAHRTQPRLQLAVVALHPIVGVPVGTVPGRRQQVLQQGRVHRRLIGGDLGRRDLRRIDRPFEEALGRLHVAPPGDIDVDDLPELVDGPIHVVPLARDLHVRLVHLPAISHAMPARPGGVDQQRREAQHPPVDGDVVDLDATLDEQLFDVAVGQAEA